MIVSPISKCAGFCLLFTLVLRMELTAMCMQASALPQNYSPFSFVFWDRFKFPKLAFNSLWNTGTAFFSDPPDSASWRARITDLYHQVQLQNGFEILAWLFLGLKWKSYSILLKTFIRFLRLPYNVFAHPHLPSPPLPTYTPRLPHPSNYVLFLLLTHQDQFVMLK